MTLKNVLFFIFLNACLIFWPFSAKTWSDCPLGQSNDVFPGLCTQYVDTNQNGICDHSEIGPKKQNPTASSSLSAKNEKNQPANNYYPLLFLTILLTVSYLATYYLQKNKIISLGQHYFFWNLVLLISFLLSGILGILLALEKNFVFAINLPFNPLLWHVNIGVIMFIAGLIHIIHKRAYFINFFSRKIRQKNNKL